MTTVARTGPDYSQELNPSFPHCYSWGMEGAGSTVEEPGLKWHSCEILVASSGFPCYTTMIAPNRGTLLWKPSHLWLYSGLDAIGSGHAMHAGTTLGYPYPILECLGVCHCYTAGLSGCVPATLCGRPVVKSLGFGFWLPQHWLWRHWGGKPSDGRFFMFLSYSCCHSAF